MYVWDLENDAQYSRGGGELLAKFRQAEDMVGEERGHQRAEMEEGDQGAVPLRLVSEMTLQEDRGGLVHRDQKYTMKEN